MTEKERSLIPLATQHVGDMVRDALLYAPPARALVVYDSSAPLARILTAAYQAVLPGARFIDFDTATKEAVIASFDTLSPGDLVVLIQSSNFRLDEFRIRLHLFSKKLKVIEHMHLYRNTEPVWDVYINSLAYDKAWYHTIGTKIKAQIDRAEHLTIKGGSATLHIAGGMEDAKLNIGDYRGMDNIGGTFPIGEVFTEARDFSTMNGSAMIYAFAGGDFCVNMHEPFRIDITGGVVTGWDERAPQGFVDIVEAIRLYERPLIREIGLGLNRAITRERYVEDITAFERIYGLHLSMGEKHSVYKKEGIPTHKTKFHVDLFPVTDEILTDKDTVYSGGIYSADPVR